MNFSEIFSKTWRDYKSNSKVINKFLFVFFVIPTLIILILSLVFMLSIPSIRENVLTRVVDKENILLTSPLFIVFLIFSVIINIIIFVFTQSSILNLFIKEKRISYEELIKSGKENFWKYFVFSLVTVILLSLLFILLIIPGIIFTIFWVFGLYVYFDQKKGIMESLRKSKELVSGRWWRVLGYLILLVLIYALFSIVINIIAFILILPFNIAGGISVFPTLQPITQTYFIASSVINAIAKLVLDLIALPFGIIFMKNLYFEFKKSKK